MSTVGAEQILHRAYAGGFRNSVVVTGRTLLRVPADRKAGSAEAGPVGAGSTETEVLRSIPTAFADAGMPLEHSALLVCALSYYNEEADDISAPEDPQGAIAPFARANYYREAVERLRAIVRWLRERTDVPIRETRIFCNSRLPEKLLGAMAGLGFYGKNSLLISPGLGSRFIIAILAFPTRLLYSDTSKPSPAAPPGGRCGDCVACIQACPTGALHAAGRVDDSLCLQALATRMCVLPDRIKRLWGTRLYGCESCQDPCPFNKGLAQTMEIDRGVTGPGISIKELLGLSITQLRKLFKPTPMGMSWINPLSLVRNALLAAGNSGNQILIPAVTPYLAHEHEVLNDAARWAMVRLLGS